MSFNLRLYSMLEATSLSVDTVHFLAVQEVEEENSCDDNDYGFL